MSQETILYEIELPKPSEKIRDILYEIYNAHFVTNTGVMGYYKGDGTAADNLLNVAGTYEHLELSRQVRKEYSEYFPGIEISGYFGIFRGDHEQTGVAKRYRTHVDITRCANLNYYYELGGPDVQTWFYDFFNDDDSRVTPISFHNTSPKELGYRKFETDTWYLFNGGIQAHSVENLMGLRMFLGITLLRDDSEKIKFYDDQSITDQYISNSNKTLERSPYKYADVLSKMEQVGINYTSLSLTNK